MSTSRRAMRLATAGATLGLTAALTLVGTALSGDDGDAYETVSERPALPLGSPIPGYVGAEDTAIRLASTLQAVDRAPGQPCPADDLVVSWDDPGNEFESGAGYEPVGPRPEGNESANGIVSCEGSDFDYTGFNIDWDGSRWTADLAPDVADEGPDGPAPGGGGDDPGDPTDPIDPSVPTDPGSPAGRPRAPTDDDLAGRLADTMDEVRDIVDLQVTDDWQGVFDDVPIEPLAAYEPQTTCSPAPKPGTYGFSEMVLDAFSFTDSSGIARACDQGARSEHKEGRAWDWSAAVDDPQDARAASQVIGWLLATDEHGNEYAMARRLGIMYIIYNRSIWRAYAPEQGWVGYTGPSPHTDHVHFSFDRAGGMGETSFWDVAELPELTAEDLGPYALLPDAGGVSTSALSPDTSRRLSRPPTGRSPTAPGGGSTVGSGGGGGGTTSGGDGSGGLSGTPDEPTLSSVVPPTSPTILEPLPTLPPLSGGGDGGGGGDPALPTCPPGTPVFPVPLDCLLPGL
jgi:hypothetical protein